MKEEFNENSTKLLFEAVRNREDSAEVERLISEGNANYNAVDSNGNTPLLIAYAEGSLENVKILVEKGADINAADKDGETILYEAVRLEMYEEVKLLINLGADVNVVNNEGDTPLHTVEFEKGAEITNLLIEKGANIEAVNKKGDTPLHRACYNIYQDIAEVLLEGGANLEAVNNYGKTPLYLVLNNYYNRKYSGIDESEILQAVSLLVEKGVDIKKLGPNGETPLSVALDMKYVEVAALLIQKGAYIEQSSLHQLLEYKYPGRESIADLEYADIVKLLLERGVSVNSIDSKGRTALHIACEQHKEDVVALLLQYGADVDIKDRDGNAPLHLAVKNNIPNHAVVRLLIEKGADIEAINKVGLTAIHLKPIIFNKAFLLPIFKEAIDNGNTQVLSNLCKYEHFRTQLSIISPNDTPEDTSTVQEFISFLSEYNSIPLGAENKVKELYRIQGKKIELITTDSQEISKVIKVLTNAQDNIYQKALNLPELQPLIMEYLGWQKQWSPKPKLEIELEAGQVYKSIQSMDEIAMILRKLGINNSMLLDKSLNSLQLVFNFSDEVKQNLSDQFHSAISHPQEQGELIAGKDFYKAFQFMCLKLIAKTLSYNIDYYSKADSMIHFSGGGDASDNFKIYETSDGKQLISKLKTSPKVTELVSLKRAREDEYVDEDSSEHGNKFQKIIDAAAEEYESEMLLENAQENNKEPSSESASNKEVLEGAEVNLINRSITEEAMDVVKGYSIDISFGHSPLENSFIQDHHHSKQLPPHLKILEVIMPKITFQGAAQESEPEILKLKSAQDSKHEQSKKAVSYGEIFYKATISLKAADTGLDAFKVAHEPTLENLNLFMQNAAHLGVIVTGTTGYLPLVSAVDIFAHAYNGEYAQAIAQAGVTAGYMLLPTMLGTSLAPIYTGAILAYTGYKVASKAYSIYSNYGTVESQLKSDLAYSELYNYLGFKNKSEENYSDTKDEGAKNNESSSIQDIADKYNLLGKICDLDPIHDYCQ